MIIMGWIFTVLGAILSITGFTEYNDAQSEVYGLYKYYDNSDVESASILLAIGIILFILGIVFLIIGYLRKNSNQGNNVTYSNRLNTRRCLQCGSIVDITKRFCPRCGSNLNGQTNANDR